MIILYSNHCPRCGVLKAKLDSKNIDYRIEDDVDKLIEMGFQTMPILEVDSNRMMYMDAINYINQL